VEGPEGATRTATESTRTGIGTKPEKETVIEVTKEGEAPVREVISLLGAIDAMESVILVPDAGDKCPGGYFHCNTTAQCVPQRANCDGSVDCDDASDEFNCVNEVDAKYWDHLYRKQPFGKNDNLRIGECRKCHIADKNNQPIENIASCF